MIVSGFFFAFSSIFDRSDRKNAPQVKKNRSCARSFEVTQSYTLVVWMRQVGDYVLFGTYIIQLYTPLNWFGTYYR